MKPKVLARITKYGGVDYHRVSRPMMHLADQGEIELRFIYEEDDKKAMVNKGDLEWATHFIYARYPNVAIPDPMFISFIKKFDLKLIVDADDWWELPDWHASKENYEKGFKDVILNNLKLADEVWTTNETLKGYILEHNTNVHVIPNSIAHKDPQWSHPKQKHLKVDGKKVFDKRVRFGYLGAQHHIEDLKWSKINLLDKLGFCTGDLGEGQDYGEVINAKYRLSSMNPHEYGQLYSVFDVSLVPLMPSKFAECKSNLKLLEAGFSKTAVIATNTPPYGEFADCVSYIEPGNDFNPVIDLMTKRRAKEMGKALNEAVQEYTMDNINPLRLERLLVH